MKVPLLDLTAQYRTIRDEVRAGMDSVVERQQFILGPEVGLLEEALIRLCGTRAAVSCASGTDALLLPLMTLGLGPDDEVIVPTFTFFASAGTVVNAGGTPVFVDIEPGTFNVTAEAIESAITPRTRAIIAVHLFGQMAEIERILDVAARHGLPVIEDAAQAIGARRRIEGTWRMAGELGWVGTFSFYPSKTLGAYGDGGAIVTQDVELGERLARLRRHGGARDYHHDEVGTNSRLDSLQAAILLAKLPSLEAWSAARRARASAYTDAFADLEEVVAPTVDPANEHGFHQYTVRVQRRDALRTFLSEREIGTAVYYPVPLHRQPCFADLDYVLGSLPVSEQAAEEVVSLPVYPELTEAQQEWVVESVRAFYRGG